MVSTAIVGSGPSALALAYILQGHRPVYDPHTHGPHPDAYLHELLLRHADLLEASADETLLNYVAASPNFTSFFSASVLPVNLLLDVLRFGNEIAAASPAAELNSRIRWIDAPAITDCVIVGDAIGGQWASDSVDDPDTLAISYVEMLSLPGYSLSEYLQCSEPFVRPSRAAVARYYAEYARRFNLPIITGRVEVVTAAPRSSARTARFRVQIQGCTAPILCQHVVLATGVNECAGRAYNEPPRAQTADATKIAVIGSGLSAADAVLAAWKEGKDVVHEFSSAEMLKKYPKGLYPEYHSVYVAMTHGAAHYERGVGDDRVPRKYRLGRRGSLEYAKSILPFRTAGITRMTLRERGAACPARGLAPHVWACGSLCGDTTVRYLIGSCCAVAGALQRQHAADQQDPDLARATPGCRSRGPALTSNPHTAACCARDVSPSRAA